jgi:hypothetical protein
MTVCLLARRPRPSAALGAPRLRYRAGGHEPSLIIDSAWFVYSAKPKRVASGTPVHSLALSICATYEAAPWTTPRGCGRPRTSGPAASNPGSRYRRGIGSSKRSPQATHGGVPSFLPAEPSVRVRTLGLLRAALPVGDLSSEKLTEWPIWPFRRHSATAFEKTTAVQPWPWDWSSCPITVIHNLC